MSEIFGVRIKLGDHESPVTPSNSLGIFNRTGVPNSTISAGGTTFSVPNASDIFEAGDIIYIGDDFGSEVNSVSAVSGTVITANNTFSDSYLVDDNPFCKADTVLRWSQCSISGVSATWADEMIIRGGIGRYGKKIDLSKGGNIETSGSAQVIVQNANQFNKELTDRSIYLNGYVGEIWKFTDTTGSKVWLGECEKPVYDSMQYKIKMTGIEHRRRANISTTINPTTYPNADSDDIGQIVPCTIGQISKAVFKRVVAYKTLLTVEDLISTEVYHRPLNTKNFPVVDPNLGTAATDTYKFKLANRGNSVVLNDLTDYVVQITDGDGQGDYRKIESSSWDGTNFEVEVVFESHFSDVLQGTPNATASEQTWVQFYDIGREYECDTWPCTAFIDLNGNTASGGEIDIYAYSDNKNVIADADGGVTRNIKEFNPNFILLPRHAYKDSGDSDNNNIDIDVKLFERDIDQMSSFRIEPITEIRRADASDLDTSGWYINGTDGSGEGAWPLVASGIYSPNSLSINPYAGGISTSDQASAWDKDSTTDAEFENNLFNNGATYWCIVEFTPPQFPAGFSEEFDACYLGLNCLARHNISGVSASQFKMRLRYKRWIGSPQDIIDSTIGDQFATNRVHTFNCLPDFYFTTDDPDTANEDFYHSAITNDVSIKGYTNYEMSGITTKEQYEGIDKIAIMFRRQLDNNPSVWSNDYIQVYEAGVIFKKNVSIKKSIFTGIQGRTFNDTWGSRKTAANMIQNPIDTLEHVCRLQNWSENSVVAGDGFGREYGDNALICTSGDGSFDDASLDSIKSYSTQNQILRYREAFTDVLKRQLCKNFFLANYTNSSGQECVDRITKNIDTPSDTITLADIINRDTITIDEPQPRDIYVEPFVRYNKNFATGEYQSEIRVYNVSANTYTAGYVTGNISAALAEELWTRCNSLWKKSRTIEKPPNDMTDLGWVNSNDAAADNIAADYIFNWVDWMDKYTVKFQVHLNTVSDWELMHPFYLQLPHETNNLSVECITTGIEYNPNPPYDVTITAILLTGDIPAEYIYIDVMAAQSGDNIWIDTTTLYGNDQDKIDTMT